MYAVVKTGGKQYRVEKDDVLTVEKLAGDAGATVELEHVLAINDGKGLTVGTPLLKGARVAATVLEQKKADKVVVFKKKRRKNYRRTKGHRQQITVIRINDILSKSKAAAEANTDTSAKAAAGKKIAKGKTKGKGKAKAKGKGKAKVKKAPVKKDK
ncbi:MAG: 50S ribosomal protein L21 [Pseudomonadota bacterium]|nr:50S ribosomal protein L21 [Pseudomonadota bacterium]